jgi:hypothetical protein
MVVVGSDFQSSTALLIAERRYLHSLGWDAAEADTGDETAADSPGHELRLIYATAQLDLKDLDLGWIKRSPVIGRALAATMFARQSAISLMLQIGTS